MERWSSRTAFILASVGSAVGMGNIWRFSSVVGQNGGGAYLVPYLTAVFAFALPLMMLELAAGRRLRGDVVTAFGRARPRFRPLGWVVCAVVFSILSYYLVVTGWTLAYVVFSIAGEGVEFADFTSTYRPISYFIVSALMMGAIVSLGIKDGIERATKLLIPFSFLLLLGLAAFSSTLEGFGAGRRYLFTPDFSVLADPLLWAAAFGQAFFSLSVGYGILLTYGDYLDEGVGILNSSLIITVADLGVAILAGLVIFPVVFTYGLEPTAGAELAFSTLPRAFEVMPYGAAFAVAFFALLFSAAMTSAVSMLEVSAASVVAATGISRRRVSFALRRHSPGAAVGFELQQRRPGGRGDAGPRHHGRDGRGARPRPDGDPHRRHLHLVYGRGGPCRGDGAGQEGGAADSQVCGPGRHGHDPPGLGPPLKRGREPGRLGPYRIVTLDPSLLPKKQPERNALRNTSKRMLRWGFEPQSQE